MRAIPAMLLLSGTVVLGLLLGVEYLRRVRSKPTVIGFHFLLGAGALEVIAMLLRGTPDGAARPLDGLLQWAAGLLALALFSGLMVPLIGRRSRATMNVALAIHVTLAIAGSGLCVGWCVRGAF